LTQRVLQEQGSGDDARVVLKGRLNWEGTQSEVEGRGNGPVEAYIQALSAATGHDIRIVDYHQHAIGTGADARAVAYMEVKIDDSRSLFGVGIDADIIAASFNAIISGLRRGRPYKVNHTQPVAEAA
jgi:2-isopropylmalate synthase